MKASQLPLQPEALTVPPSESKLYAEALDIIREIKAMLQDLRKVAGGEA